MNFCRPILLFILLSLTGFCPRWTRAQTQSNGKPSHVEESLKLLKSPIAEFPAEALRKNIEGKVQLILTVDAQGRVSDATILSGPPELYQSALDNVKQWQFAPPTLAPAKTKAEIVYFHLHPCPGPISTMGSVFASGRLTNAKGTIVDVLNDPDWPLPPYFAEDRENGVAGDMVLSVTIDARGKAKKVEVVNSLSPHLDKAAVKTIRAWRFKLRDGSSGSLPDTFPLHITFQPECVPE